MEADTVLRLKLPGQPHCNAAAGAAEANLQHPVHLVVANAPQQLLHLDPDTLGHKPQPGGPVYPLAGFLVGKLSAETVLCDGPAGFTQKQAAQIMRKVAAAVGFSAQAGVHAADVGGILQRRLQHVHGDDHLLAFVGNIHIQRHDQGGGIFLHGGGDHNGLFVHTALPATLLKPFGVLDEDLVQFAGKAPALIVHAQDLFLEEIINPQTVAAIFPLGEANLFTGKALLVQIEDIAFLINVAGLQCYIFVDVNGRHGRSPLLFVCLP